MKENARLAVPIGIFTALAAMLIWLGGNALAMEQRVSRCEERIDGIRDMLSEVRTDIKEIKRQQVELLARTDYLRR